MYVLGALVKHIYIYIYIPKQHSKMGPSGPTGAHMECCLGKYLLHIYLCLRHRVNLYMCFIMGIVVSNILKTYTTDFIQVARL